VEGRAGRVKERREDGEGKKEGKEGEWGCALPETKSWLRHCAQAKNRLILVADTLKTELMNETDMSINISVSFMSSVLRAGVLSPSHSSAALS